MIDEIQKKKDNSFLFGCVKYKNNHTFYLLPIADWILNYTKYDPGYNPDDWIDGHVFRDNILNVEDDKIEGFLQAVEGDKIEVSSIDIKQYDLKHIFLFFVDFDSKTFISYFDDIEIEQYLPDEEWVGKFDNPLTYLPQELKEYLL